MSIIAKAATGAVGAAFIAGVWLYVGKDPEAVAQFLKGNWGPFLLAVQIVASAVLMALDRYIAGAIVAGTALLSVIGMVARWPLLLKRCCRSC